MLIRKIIRRLRNNFFSGYKNWVPPGHFYSPIPDIEEVKANEDKIFGSKTKHLNAIQLNDQEQLKLLEIFKEYYGDLPFKAEKADGLRYYFENPAYSYFDAICLYSMIRFTKPQKIIEVGSGYSSCVILDTNELFFENQISCTFVEPYPQLLGSLLEKGDENRIEIIARKLQNVDLSLFSNLSSGDILFIDSTHVSKINSDVNHIIFEILPLLKKGVYVHFHDIQFPFEYSKKWIYEGRAWNEAYILRAFLQYNNSFSIVFFNSYLNHFYQEKFRQDMPLCLKNCGGSIWLQKIND